MSGPQARARLDELLQDRALGGLGWEEESELVRILDQLGFAPDDVPPDWELAASQLALELLPPADEPPPPHVMRRVAGDALAWFAVDHELPLRQIADSLQPPPRAARSQLPWWLCIAAGLLALWSWFAPGAAAPESADDGRRRLLAAGGPLVELAWMRGPSELAGAPAGDVVWSPQQQQGYMRLCGLPRNEPDHSRYQLWIFDGERDAAQPVDGGLFDIRDAAATACIRIDAKLPVARATAFAITVERPEGAVVSTRQHVVATAGL